MLSSGSDSYTWDARNHLVSTLSGAGFQYDPFGRRTARTISGATTNYLYEGLNPVQELSGGTPTANLLTGSIDEHFTRTDSAGARNFLTDPLGSTVALVDSSGMVQTQYTYEPFGNTAVSGTASANPYQYTGREDDGTGLYFYRARYYSPTLQRFVGQDPAGFVGGANVYAYVGNAPTEFLDPLGLDKNDPLKKAICSALGRGALSHNIPFLNIPVRTTGSITVGPINVTTTGDVSVVVPLFPYPSPFNLGLGTDTSIGAPPGPLRYFRWGWEGI
jgi:RHS repeat-associated protein